MPADDHEKVVTCEQVLMRPNEVTRNGRIYPTTKNKGDDIMENKNNKNGNNLSNEALNNLKELTDSMNNLLDQFLNKSDGNTKESNMYDTCKCNNKQCEDEKKNDPDQDEAANVREMVERFADHLGEALGCKAAVISMDELESMCNGCHDCDDNDDEDYSDDYDEIIARLKHLEEGIRIILRGQNESNIANHMIPNVIRKGKPVASKKRVKKIERKLERFDRIVDSQQQEINKLKIAINKLTTQNVSKESKSDK